MAKRALIRNYATRVLNMAENVPCSSSHSDAGSDDESSTSELTHSSSEQFSLLERLKRPKASELSRKRKIPCNPPKGLKKGKGIVSAEPQKVTASSRVSEFPNQNLSVVLVNYFVMPAANIYL